MAIPVSDSVSLPVVDSGNGTLTDEFVNILVQDSSRQFGDGPRVLTYSFSVYDDPAYAWTAQLKNAFLQALDSWSNVANLSFVEAGSGTVFLASTADLAATLSGTDLHEAGLAALTFLPDADAADALRAAFPEYQHPEGDMF